MNPTKLSLYFDLLNRALDEEMGVVLESNNPQQLSLHLTEAKRASDRFKSLTICVDSRQKVLIVKPTVRLDEIVEAEIPE